MLQRWCALWHRDERRDQSASIRNACFGQAITASATADSISGGGSGRRMSTTSSSIRSTTSGAAATHNALASQRSGSTVTFIRKVDHRVLLTTTKVFLNACLRPFVWHTPVCQAFTGGTGRDPTLRGQAWLLTTFW